MTTGRPSREPVPVLVVGPLPPPVHGAAKNTAHLVELLRGTGPVLTADTSPGDLSRTPAYYLRRLAAVPRVARALVRGRRLGAHSLYLAVDGGAGLVFNLGYVVLARASGYRVTLHHRSFRYLERYDVVMRAVRLVAGRAARHAFLCARMRDLFEQRYGPVESLVVSNAATLSVPVAAGGRRRDGSLSSRRVRIGFLGNVTFDKGIDTFTAAALALEARGWSVTATIAGPASDRAAQEHLEGWLDARPDLFRWVGAVRDAPAKAAFLDGQDVLVFPTRYRNEAQPNVVLEAMARGLPVVATRCGCLESDVSSAAGVLLDQAGDLPALVADAVAHLCRDEAAWEAHSRAALDSVRSGAVEAGRQLDDLLSRLR